MGEYENLILRLDAYADDTCTAAAVALEAQAKRIAELERERDEAVDAIKEMEPHIPGMASLRYRAEAAEAKVARLREALMALTDNNCAYDGPNIVTPAGSHGNAINTMRLARAALKDTQP